MKPGESTDITIRGSGLSGATELWTSFPAQCELAPGVENNGQSADSVIFRVTVAEDVPVGIYGVRVTTPGGTSNLRLLAVDDLPSVAADNKNASPDAAQSLSLPAAVDGALPSLARRFYRFEAQAGQRVSIEVLARRFGSVLDPIIRLFDARGRELTYSDDSPGLSGDARLCHTFAEAGEYLIELSDIRYQGGDTYFYRLRIGDFPCVVTPYPMGVQRGSRVEIDWAGSNIEGAQPVELSTAADSDDNWHYLGVRRDGGQSSGFALLMLGEKPEVLETEPNDSAEQANRVDLGAQLNGRLNQPGDVDRFTFTAKKGQAYRFSATTRQFGSPADLFLRLLDSQGAMKAQADDTGTLDGVLTFTFPADEEYTLQVEDLNRRGGSEFAYRVAVEPVVPGFTLTASTDRLNIPAGGTATMMVTAIRTNYNGPIQLQAVGLNGDSITNTSAVIGPGQNSAVLALRSSAESERGRLTAVKIVGTAEINGERIEEAASVEAALKASLNNMPWPPAPISETVAVAISPAPKFTLRTEPEQIVFGRNLQTKVNVIAKRTEGFNEAITLAIQPEKNGLPGNVTAAVKPIAKDQNEVEILFSANEKAPLGEFSAILQGTLKQDNTTVVQTTPGIGLKLDKPFRLSVQSDENQIAAGGELKWKVQIERNPAFTAAVELVAVDLPQGVTAAQVTIPPDQSEIEVTLTASAEAATVESTAIKFQGTATVGKTKFAETSPGVTISVAAP